MKNPIDGKTANLRYFIAIIPIVMIVIIIFSLLVRNKILSLSRERLSLIAEDYAGDISTWADKVLKELNIYLDIIDEEGVLSEHTMDIISTSADSHEEYPYGIYWGDEQGNYFDSSGWVPDEDYVPSQRNWYIEGLEHSRFVFGEPYLDEMTGGTCVSASARRDYDGVVSVFAADVYLDHASSVIGRITEGEEAFFVTRQSRFIVADTNAERVGQRLDGENLPLLYRNINELLDRDFVGQALVQGDRAYYVNINRIESTDWYFVACMSKDAMMGKLRRVEGIMLAMGLAACVILAALTVQVSREMNDADQKARTDPLTRLLNRDEFRRLSVMALAENPSQGMLLFFDMDNFKQINDQLGHPEGDEVLKKFSALLYEYFNRSKDIAGRIGGDEFAVFLGRKVAPEDAGSMLAKFIELFHGAFDEKYHAQKLSVSIGAAFVEDVGGDYGALYQKADEALYKSKQNGKNRFSI